MSANICLINQCLSCILLLRSSVSRSTQSTIVRPSVLGISALNSNRKYLLMPSEFQLKEPPPPPLAFQNPKSRSWNRYGYFLESLNTCYTYTSLILLYISFSKETRSKPKRAKMGNILDDERKSGKLLIFCPTTCTTFWTIILNRHSIPDIHKD